MNTDQLISLLAEQATPVRPHAARRRLMAALGWALPLALAAMMLRLGLRPDFWQSLASVPMASVKIVSPAAFALAAFVALERLGRPGLRAGAARWCLALPVLLLWVLGLSAWWNAPEAARAGLLWGESWQVCPFNILALSLPVLAAGLIALRGLAPTRPALAGAAAGALAGGCGAAVYALHCPEMGAPFIAVWYVLGMVLPIALGALLGRPLLRW